MLTRANAIVNREMARPAGFEPATLGLEGRCSIQMSYGRSAVLCSWLASDCRLTLRAGQRKPGTLVSGYDTTTRYNPTYQSANRWC